MMGTFFDAMVSNLAEMLRGSGALTKGKRSETFEKEFAVCLSLATCTCHLVICDWAPEQHADSCRYVAIVAAIDCHLSVERDGCLAGALEHFADPCNWEEREGRHVWNGLFVTREPRVFAGVALDVADAALPPDEPEEAKVRA